MNVLSIFVLCPVHLIQYFLLHFITTSASSGRLSELEQQQKFQHETTTTTGHPQMATTTEGGELLEKLLECQTTCGGRDECQDVREDLCIQWARRNFCTLRFYSTMRWRCARTCRLCIPIRAGRHDVDVDADYANYGLFERRHDG
uniref:ShKT domain-containing protein n=1 Tax=Globodera pallida TaxID=36090 RepID=A0A183C1G4_GLOPA